jgi:hypothetical protein
MNYGEGTITRKEVIAATGISDPLSFFKEMPAISSGKLVLAPHVYPGTLTGGYNVGFYTYAFYIL